MAINASEAPTTGGGQFKAQDPMELGNYPTRLVQVIDLGLQPQRPYQGQEKPPCREIFTTYEFLDEFMKDEDGNDIEDKPRWLSETLPLKNLSVDNAKSTKRYKALDSSNEHKGDWQQVLGTPVTVTITADEGKGNNAGKIYNNIASTAPMRAKDADKAADLVNPPKFFDLDEPDMTIFLSLPEWLQEKIKGNLNFKGSKLESLITGAPVAVDTPSAPDAPEVDENDVPW
jgi:hypothetical protein